jgi:hypothetical protein
LVIVASRKRPGPAVRLAEAKAAGQALGIHHRTLLHLPNRRLFDTFEARVLVAKEFRKYRCTRIYFTGENTRPNFRQCDYAFTFDNNGRPEHYRLPLVRMRPDTRSRLQTVMRECGLL